MIKLNRIKAKYIMDFDHKLQENSEKINQITQRINNDIDYYVDHVTYNKLDTNSEIISIVMTTHNRVTQTLFTLDTIADSSNKIIQVIIVDDSDKTRLTELQLSKYKFQIDYVRIKSDKRDWINPCVNYNIGFKYIIGSITIIQNAEVCHKGDVTKFIKDNCTIDNYLVFDVITTRKKSTNKILYENYQNGTISENFINDLTSEKYPVRWRQHHASVCSNLHFLTAIHTDNLKKMNGFDYDFSLGRWRDDVEFINRIKFVLGLTIVNVNYITSGLLGIHQHHLVSMLNSTDGEYQKSICYNYYIYIKKAKIFNSENIWPFFYTTTINDFATIRL